MSANAEDTLHELRSAISSNSADVMPLHHNNTTSSESGDGNVVITSKYTKTDPVSVFDFMIPSCRYDFEDKESRRFSCSALFSTHTNRYALKINEYCIQAKEQTNHFGEIRVKRARTSRYFFVVMPDHQKHQVPIDATTKDNAKMIRHQLSYWLVGVNEARQDTFFYRCTIISPLKDSQQCQIRLFGTCALCTVDTHCLTNIHHTHLIHRSHVNKV